MISVSEFLRCVEANAARVQRYKLGCDGSGGACDCIGLIIGAVRMAGEKWPWTHGSNYAARNLVDDLRPIQTAADLFPGEVVFKDRDPGEKGYDLPDRYKTSGDLKDYYHVGVVTSISPLCITHCTSVPGGIQRDGTLGKWKWGGKLKIVDYAKEDKPMETLYRAIVTAENGKTVNMRQQPSTSSKVVEIVPVGAVVDVTREIDAAWAQIRNDGAAGYMMRKFLAPAGDGPGEAPALPPERAAEIKRLLQDALALLGE